MDEVRIEAVAKYMHDSVSDSLEWDQRDDDTKRLYRDRAKSLLSVADAVDPLRSVDGHHHIIGMTTVEPTARPNLDAHRTDSEI